jgi:hypothetical protein
MYRSIGKYTQCMDLEGSDKMDFGGGMEFKKREEG